MSKSRVIVETNPAVRKDLEAILQERGITLTEWFSEKIFEDSIQPEAQDDIEEVGTSKTRPKEVLSAIKKVDWSFTDDNTSHTTHSIHPYPAKFIPQIPHKLIQLLSVKGDRVWDPFGGSGTTALEALRLGRDAISTDINPVATLVGNAKTSSLSQEDEEELDQFIAKLELLCSSTDNLERIIVESQRLNEKLIPDIPNLEKWFAPIATQELAFIKGEINKLKSPSVKILATAAFSKIITRVSNQDGETRYVSKPKSIERGYAIKIYRSELKSIYNKARQLSKLLQFRTAEFITSNLVKENPVEAESVDLVITSPPYPNATDYHLYHRFRIYWLGSRPQEMAIGEIGSHLRHQRNEKGIEEYLQEMAICLEKVYASLKHGKYAVFVIGDSMFKTIEYKTAELVGELANEVGFEVVGIVKRPVHATKRSFIGAARRLREEKLLILRKAPESQKVELIKPPYKLWPYEEVIRDIENEVLLGKTPSLHNIKRLTFTHHFKIGDSPKEPTWQAIVENGDAASPGARKDPKYVTHGLHAYKGKFYPQLAKSLINVSGIKQGSTILDPFGGSGTVLLESYLNGFNGIGMDLNPLAVKIARAKSGIIQVEPKVFDGTVSKLLTQLESRQTSQEILAVYEDRIDEILSWFPRSVAIKLAHILNLIKDTPDPAIRDFLEVCLSSIVREVSQQEPRDLRIRRRSTPIDDADVFALYRAKVIEQRDRILKFHAHSHKRSGPFGSVSANLLDCRELESYGKAGIAEGSVDAIVTSPPYATALPYIDTDRLSILLLFGLKPRVRNEVEESLIGAREIKTADRNGLNDQIEELNFSEIKSEYAKNIIKEVYVLNRDGDVGFRRKNMGSLLYRYFNDMSKAIKNLDYVLKPGGQAFFVIGNNKTLAGKKDIVIDSAKFIVEAAHSIGWKTKNIIPITVTQENRLHNKNGITENDIIWMQK